jgi:hypothetical protein
MDSKKAILILGLNDETVTMENIKKQYRYNALKYHPDKNKSADASEKFQEIHLAYEYLLNNHFYQGEPDNEDDFLSGSPADYKNMLREFIDHIWKGGSRENTTLNKIIHIILGRLSKICENQMVELLEKLDKNLLIKIYDILKVYKDIFYFSNTFFEKMEEVLSDKIKNDECIILNPSLDDLFENNLYKLTVNGEVYIIPLWHHELVYDNSGNDLYVRCYPILPENIVIVENNNIVVNLQLKVKDLLDLETFSFEIGKRKIEMKTSELSLAKNQIKIFYNEGISIINMKDIYDVSKKSHIYLNIELV